MSGIVGTDGQTPIYEENARWATWRLSEIYTGGAGLNRYVPKVNDYVVDTDTDARYIVTALEPSTLVPTLQQIVPVPVDPIGDVLLGVGPGTTSDTYRVYVDQSVMPHVLAVDERLYVRGSSATKCRIFKGAELSDENAVISARYDGSGNLLGTDLALEVASQTGNISTKVVTVGYTTHDLPDGELVWAVFYSDEGHVVSKRQLLIENTAFIRSITVGVKYIVAISLESPFLSNSDPNLIQYPLNMPLEGLTLTGVVHYSDGSVSRQPVDGTKFSIFGFENFISTIVGLKLPLVLKYTLSQGEVVYNAQAGDGKFITKTYQATTIDTDGAYSVKLFCVPNWVDGVSGYRLDWYLYNLERQVVTPCTSHVTFNPAAAPFGPLVYGVSQQVQVSVNLNEVSSVYKSYTHAQVVDVVLNGPGTSRTTNWTLAYDPNQSPRYGLNLHANSTFIDSTHSVVNLASGSTTQADWLLRVFNTAKPLIDAQHEVDVPIPTHFAILVNGSEVQYPMSQWNADLSLNAVLANNSTLVIKFFKRTSDSDLQLGLGAMPVYQNS